MPIPHVIPPHQPQQLALPLRLPPTPVVVDAGTWQISPTLLWPTLTREEQDQCRQRLLAVLLEVVHDRPPF